MLHFFGVVGSGKSTAAKYALDILGRSGLRTKYLRFQSLSSLKFVAVFVAQARQVRHLRPELTRHRCGYSYRRRKLTLVALSVIWRKR
jgi:hypothetical protein